MIEHFEVTTHAGAITLYKSHRQWQRPRFVRLKAGFASRSYAFPADQDSLRINHLPENEICWLTVRHGQLSKRYLSRPWKQEIVAQQRRLKLLVSGSGCCGIHSLASFLNGLRFREGRPACARHETLREYILPAIAAGDQDNVRHITTGFRHAIETSSYFALVPECVEADKVVHLIRDGRNVVQSGLNRGWYQDDKIGNRIKPTFEGDLFRQCCQFWTCTVRNMAAIAHLTMRYEELLSSRGAMTDFLDYLEISPTERPFPGAEQGYASSEFEHWTRRHHATFAEECGELMDTYYPSWR